MSIENKLSSTEEKLMLTENKLFDDIKEGDDAIL
jgi:hypothetical protein